MKKANACQSRFRVKHAKNELDNMSDFVKTAQARGRKSRQLGRKNALSLLCIAGAGLLGVFVRSMTVTDAGSHLLVRVLKLSADSHSLENYSEMRLCVLVLCWCKV